MNILIVDPKEHFSRSARVSLANHTGANTVVTLFEGFKGQWNFDAAIFRIPSITLGKSSVRARSNIAEQCLEVLAIAKMRKTLHTVCPARYPFWFYDSKTDKPAHPEEVLSRPFDPKTNVFRGYYIAPDWRLILDSLIEEITNLEDLYTSTK